jgi:hypothetical protein
VQILVHGCDTHEPFRLQLACAIGIVGIGVVSSFSISLLSPATAFTELMKRNRFTPAATDSSRSALVPPTFTRRHSDSGSSIPSRFAWTRAASMNDGFYFLERRPKRNVIVEVANGDATYTGVIELSWTTTQRDDRLP